MLVWISKVPWFLWLTICCSCSQTNMVLASLFMAKRADEEIQFQEPDQAWRFQLSKSQIKPGGSNFVYVCFQISF